MPKLLDADLYKPVKEWQGLSDEEILEIDHDMAFARAIEAKLREKNT